MSNSAKWIIAIIVIILIISGIWYWSGAKKPTTNNEPIKIGLSAPLTGEGASWGQNALAAAALAVKEVNDRGGINGRQVQLITEDDKAGGVEATNVFNKLINVDKVSGIVGPLASAAAGPALPIAQNAKVPVVMVASAPQLTAVGDYMFRVYPSDAYQGSLGADIIFNKLAKKNAAIIYVKNDYGEGVATSFEKKFTELGGKIAYKGGIVNGTTDFRSEITKIKNSGADSLYLAMYPAGGLILARQLSEAKLTIPKVGEVTFNDENTIKSGYADGLIYTEPKSDLKDEFVARIKSQPEFKDLSVMVAAPFTYDATRALLEAISKVGSDDRAKIKDALYQVSFSGVSSPLVEFGQDREVKNPAFNIKVIKNKASADYLE